MPPRTLVTIATYNEIANLPALVDAVFEHAGDVTILVIDDNSPDGTGRWATERAAADSRMNVLNRESKQGLGSAKIAGMRRAIEQGFDCVLNLDGDFSHHPKYIPSMLEGMASHDVMIGSRYVPGGSMPDWPLHRRLMSRAVNLYARLMLGLTSRDCSSGYRCYRVSLLEKLDFATIHSSGYSFQEEVLWRLKRVGARIGETPIVFTDRRHGTSKINFREAWSALWIILHLGIKNWLGI